MHGACTPMHVFVHARFMHNACNVQIFKQANTFFTMHVFARCMHAHARIFACTVHYLSTFTLQMRGAPALPCLVRLALRLRWLPLGPLGLAGWPLGLAGRPLGLAGKLSGIAGWLKGLADWLKHYMKTLLTYGKGWH